MNDYEQQLPIEVRCALEKCLAQIRFARAAELARSRRYLEAEGVLAPSGRESSDPEELDLLARISAQQRQYGRARRRWEAALQQSPGNADYARAIERTIDAEHFQATLRKWAMTALLALAAAVLVITVWNFFPRRSRTVANKGENQPNLQAKKTPLPATPQVDPIPRPEPVPLQPVPATPSPAPAPTEPTTLPPPPPPTPPEEQ